MSNEKELANRWHKAAENILNGRANIGYIVGVISKEARACADQELNDYKMNVVAPHVRELKEENASLKEQVRQLKKVSSELLNHWDALNPIDRKTVRELYEKLRELLTNNEQSDE